MQQEISPKIVSLTFGILVILFAVSFYIFAWQEPGSAPPTGNVSTPLNTSNTGQSKAGGLILNTGGAAYGLIVDQGNVGIGTAAPSQRLDAMGYVRGSSGLCIGNDCRSSWPSGGVAGVGGSGTLNYISKFTAGTTLGNSQIFDNGTNVGIGTTVPSQKLDVNGNLKVTGFQMPTSAGAGKVLTSDASGVGSWQAPAPIPSAFGGSTLTNYGYASFGNNGPFYNVSPCPGGWAEAGLGLSGLVNSYPTSETRPAFRTCFRTDRACLTLVNYGYASFGNNGPFYNVSPCPGGWAEAGLGLSGLVNSYPTSETRPAFRTCFLCQ